MFHPEEFRRITLSDAPELIPLLSASQVNSCECVFSNLYLWGFPCGTSRAIYCGHHYFYLPCMDELFFIDTGTPEETPAPEELAAVSDAMREKGRNGSFFQVRQEYLDAHPDTGEYFDAVLLPDESAEYIYSVDALVSLQGEKLRKKRNLIRQFLRDFPDAEILPITPGKILNACLDLAETWRSHQEDPDTDALMKESEALSHLTDGFTETGCEGIAVRTGGCLAAFAVYSRINPEMFTESFEKSRPGYKGVSQFLNHEMAKRLVSRCRYINREQDLGAEGLRRAKLSYNPILLLKNFRLTRRT